MQQDINAIIEAVLSGWRRSTSRTRLHPLKIYRLKYQPGTSTSPGRICWS